MSNAPDADFEAYYARRVHIAQERERRADELVVYLTISLRFFGIETVVAPFKGINMDFHGGLWFGEPVFHPTSQTALPFGLTDQLNQLFYTLMQRHEWKRTVSTLTFDVARGKVTVQRDGQET